MDIVRTGIIINTEKYDACVAFYKNLFGLKILFDQKTGDFQLTCFEFNGAYLMIETEGFSKPEGKNIKESPAKLRLNVSDIEDALASVREYGIEAKIETYDWGSTINIFDPDGNRVGIRDDANFFSKLR